MYTIKADPKTNLLHIKLSGSIRVPEAEMIYEVIIHQTDKLTPGFIVIDDLSEFKFGDPRAGMVLQKVLKYFMQKGVSHVIRIVGASRTAILLFARFSQLFQGKIPLSYVPVMNDAFDKIAEIRSAEAVA